MKFVVSAPLATPNHIAKMIMWDVEHYFKYKKKMCVFIQCFSLFCPLQYSESRLLCPLHPGLPVLWIYLSVQYGGGSGLVRHLHVRSLLLLLLHRWPGRRLQLPLWHGLWHYGCVLWVLGLPGDLHGVLRNLFPNIKALIHAGYSQDRCWARECVLCMYLCVCVNESYGVYSFHTCEKSVPELKMAIKVIRKD